MALTQIPKVILFGFGKDAQARDWLFWRGNHASQKRLPVLCHSGNAGSIKQVGTVFDLPTQCLTGILNVETKTILYMGFGNRFRFDRQAGKLGFLYMDLLERAAPLRSRPKAKAVVQAQEEELDDLGVVPM